VSPQSEHPPSPLRPVILRTPGFEDLTVLSRTSSVNPPFSLPKSNTALTNLYCSHANGDDGDDGDKWKVIGGVLATVAVIVLGSVLIKKVPPPPPTFNLTS
jgi:hypothetical protein